LKAAKKLEKMSEKENISENDSPELRGKHWIQIKLASEKNNNKKHKRFIYRPLGKDHKAH
jgi:hypothetical protein